MKNLKAILKTEDFINSIKANVNQAIKNYNKGDDLWQVQARIATYQIKAISLQGFKNKADFSAAWDELMQLTGFEKLHRYCGISEFINKL